MKGMIFAAGIGSRLKPWTDHHPKALVEVGGRPVLHHVIDKMLTLGVSSIIINIHHFAQQIVDSVSAAYPEAPVVFSDETDELLDTGGGLAKALPQIGDDTVVVHNADIFTDISLPAMVSAHKADATLLTEPRSTARYFLLDDSRRLRGWTNITTGAVRPADLAAEGLQREAFGGVHVLSPVALHALAEYAKERPAKFSITDFYIDSCRSLDIAGYRRPDGAMWYDVGRPDTLEAARAAAISKNQS